MMKKQGGFSLIEMAIVLVVVGLLLGGALIPLSIQVEKKDRDITINQLSDMREALIGFALTNGYLPCPDTDGDGLMNRAATCAASEGGFPWVDLGVGAQDAWGQPFTYRVTAEFADTTPGAFGATCTPPLPPFNSFSLCSDGDITVLDASGGNFVATGIPAIIISHGKNWALTTSLDEAENTNGDATLVDTNYSNNNASTFDDLVIWISPNILKSKMLSAGITL